jgi:ketosteroid isomerase-like protein
MPANAPEGMPATWEAMFNTCDVEPVMTLYERDCLLVPQAGQQVAGTAAVREALPGFFAVKGKNKFNAVIRRQSDGTWRCVIDDPFDLL